MKTSLRFFIFTFLMCSFFVQSNAQSSASAFITATVVAPISIQKVAGKDLNFGNIAAGKSDGIVILSTTGTRRAIGGANFPSTSGTITTAEFLVTGEGSYSFSITLPSSPVTLVNSTNINETMMVHTFTSTPEVTGTLSAGRQLLKIGASLDINADQYPGNYTSDSPFYVTVNYN